MSNAYHACRLERVSLASHYGHKSIPDASSSIQSLFQKFCDLDVKSLLFSEYLSDFVILVSFCL